MSDTYPWTQEEMAYLIKRAAETGRTLEVMKAVYIDSRRPALRSSAMRSSATTRLRPAASRH
jgi:hypothetical protein